MGEHVVNSFSRVISAEFRRRVNSCWRLALRSRACAGAAVAFECVVAQVQPYPLDAPNCYLIFARVLLAHVDERVLDAKGRIDSQQLNLIGRLGGSRYCTTRDSFEMVRPG